MKISAKGEILRREQFHQEEWLWWGWTFSKSPNIF
jgi:hypothetical protein